MLPEETDDSHVHKISHTAQVQLEALSKYEILLYKSHRGYQCSMNSAKNKETQTYVKPVVPAQLDFVFFPP